MRRVSTSIHSTIRPGFVGLLILLALWFAPSPANAIDMQGSSIVIELELPNDNGDFVLESDVEDIKDYFNLANCICPAEFQVKLSLENAATSYDSEQVEIWVGDSCNVEPDRIDIRDDFCELATTLKEVEVLFSTTRIPIPVFSLLAPNSQTCEFDEDQRSVYALIDEGVDGIEGEEDHSFQSAEIPFDMQPPPQVRNIDVSGAENAIQIGWDLPTSRQEDIRFIQVLCARADGSEASADGFPNNGNSAEFLTSWMVCDDDSDGAHPSAVSAGASASMGPEPDAGVTDAGVTDAGVTDAGVTDAGISPDAGAGPDAGVIDETLPIDLYNLEPSTVCATAGGTESSVRVSGLENGVEYRIVLVMVDDARNPTAMDLGTFTPSPVQDAWEHVSDQSNADGGYCFVATATFGNYDHPFVRILRTFRDDTLAHSAWGRAFIDWYYDNSPELAAFIAEHPVARAVSYILLAPLVVFAAVLEYTTLLGKLALVLAFVLLRRVRRRRKELARFADSQQQTPIGRNPGRRRLVVALASIVLLLGFSATAQAQPYWDELNDEVEMGETFPKWNFEVKLGPYHPSVDDSAMGNAKPFEEFFGDDYQLMTIFSLDRYFSFPMGQLGVTGSIGYSRQSANAFALDAQGQPFEDPEKKGVLKRSDGDSSSFSLIPTFIGAVYRFTALDDEFSVPIIPYAKLGLSYYLWRFTAPDGETSEAATAKCPEPGPGAMCEGNLGRGGSLGYQGTIGIAIRAERIDPNAALSLRNEMGVEHAGFFIEGQLAVVDGFGGDTKLSVGDTTWFAGINFEF